MEATQAQTSAAGGGVGGGVGIKETLVSLIIAFTLAFVFRGYVVEPYVIPTGSMAPTLKGAHESVTDAANGYTWEITPWFESRVDPSQSDPLAQQGGRIGGFDMGKFEPVDPMTKEPVTLEQGTPLLSGDRIFVLRYVWPVFKPARFDVVVFKDPQDPSRNFIKRLIGLPNEQVALIDGDVFVRKVQEGASQPVGVNSWTLPGWTIARKDERAQRTAWQTVFDSRYTPTTTKSGKPFVGPWVAGSAGWEIDGKPAYMYKGNGPTTLRWNIEPDMKLNYGAFYDDGVKARAARDSLRHSWHLVDSYPFNEAFPVNGTKNAPGQALFFPVSDLKLAAGVEPASEGQEFAAVLRTRGHEFCGRLVPTGSGGYEAVVEMREAGNAAGAWVVLDKRPMGKRGGGVLAANAVTNVEFWHADQRVQLWVEGELAASGEYNWSPEERVARVFGKTLAEIMVLDSKSVSQGKSTQFGYGGAYCKPEPWLELSGPCTVHRVTLARDLFYQPIMANPSANGVYIRSAAGAYPGEATDKILGDEQYFVCGDNSPLSADARAWQMVDPWVTLIDPTPGVVPEKLMIGKAFLVYFPAIHQQAIFGAKIPVPNAGQVRWIW